MEHNQSVNVPNYTFNIPKNIKKVKYEHIRNVLYTILLLLNIIKICMKLN